MVLFFFFINDPHWITPVSIKRRKKEPLDKFQPQVHHFVYSIVPYNISSTMQNFTFWISLKFSEFMILFACLNRPQGLFEREGAWKLLKLR